MTFDADGNATLSGTGDATSTIELRSGKKVTLTSNPTEDVLELSKGDVVVVSEDEAVMANSIAAGGSWSVAAETAVLGNATLTTEKNHLGYNAVITADRSKGDVIDEISDLSGTATLAYGSATSIRGLTVGDNFWTIKNDSDNEVYFDESGNVTVSAGTGENILDVTGTTDAAVHVVSENVAVYNINGSTIMSYGDTEVDYALETNAQHAGIAAISGVDDDVTFTVDGDGAYKLNDFTFANTARYDAAFRIIDEDEIDMYGVRDKDNITLTGGIAEFNLTGVAEDSAKVTLNGVGVTLKGEGLSDTKILAIGDDIEAFGGIKVGTEITTSGDETFTIAYDASEVVDSASYVIAINDTKVTLKGDDFKGDEASVEVTSDGTLKIKGLALRHRRHLQTRQQRCGYRQRIARLHHVRPVR